MSHIEAKYCAHTGQIYAMVLSMGATRTWALVASDSGRFAATALVCGRGDLYTAKSFAGTSIWVFDGTKNPTVPIYESQRMVDALRVVGGVPGLAVCPNATHDSWATGSSDVLRLDVAADAILAEAGFAFRGPLWIGLRAVGSRSIVGVFYQLTQFPRCQDLKSRPKVGAVSRH